MRTVRLYRMPVETVSAVESGLAEKSLEGGTIERLRRHSEETGDMAGTLRAEHVLSRISEDELIDFRSDAVSLHVSHAYTFREQVSGIREGVRSYETVSVPFTTVIRLKLSSGLISLVDVPWPPIGHQLAELVSFLLAGETGITDRLRFDRDAFSALLYWVESSDVHEAPGTATRAIFEDFTFEGEALSEINIKAPSLSSSSLFQAAKAGSSKWRVLTFTSPLLDGLERPLTVRVSNVGGILVYTPDTSLAEIYALLDGIEVALGLP